MIDDEYADDCPDVPDDINRIRAALVALPAGEWSWEPHGDGWALYIGRSNDRHGLNILTVGKVGFDSGAENLRAFIRGAPVWLADLCNELEDSREVEQTAIEVYRRTLSERDAESARADRAERVVLDLIREFDLDEAIADAAGSEMAQQIDAIRTRQASNRRQAKK